MLFQSLFSYLYPIICNLITITCYFKRNFVNENKLQKYNFYGSQFFPIGAYHSTPKLSIGQSGPHFSETGTRTLPQSLAEMSGLPHQVRGPHEGIL
jgi:hypothetical protein